MSSGSAALARARTFFEMDPVEFVDDIVCAMSVYIQNGLEAMFAKLMEVNISQNHKSRFERELTSRMQQSVNKNADLFELFVMRNIFHIDTDVDLAGVLASPRKSPTKDQSIEYEDDDEDLDSKLAELYSQIQVEQEKRTRLVNEIQVKEAQLRVSEAVAQRMETIEELAREVKALPSEEIDGKIELYREMLQRAKAAGREKDTEKALAFHKSAFLFD